MNNDKQLDDFFGFDSEKKNSRFREGIKETFLKKIGHKSKFKLIPKVLSKKERYLIFSFVLIILGSIVAIPFTSYYHFTESVPTYGGSFDEGIIGEPRYVNPLLSQTNDSDKDLVGLIYSSLLKYNEKGKLVPDIAKSYEISSDGLNYTIYMKPDIKWHDGENLTSDDVIYTVQTAQNADYGSLQRINWQGVDIEKIDNHILMFKLKNKYAQFLNNLTLPILPKHVWQNIKPINFALSEINLKPIGTGPYKFKKLQKDKSGRVKIYELEAYKDFYGRKPYIDKIRIHFYNSEDEMINAYNNSEIENISFISPGNLNRIKFKQRINIRQVQMPRYFAVFFNQNQSALLSDKDIRLALSYGTDKSSLVTKILNSNGLVVNSPLLGEILDINKDVKTYKFSKEMAIEALNDAGWNETNEEGILIKDDTNLSLKLTTSDWPELTKVAQELKSQWKEIGIELNVEILPTPELHRVIKDRSYEMVLFGEILSIDPDPFSLWHSSQKKDPGLNLALYDNDEADKLLEEARQTLNPLERIAKYNNFQDILIEDVPAIFLYSPTYLYGYAKNIKGFAHEIVSAPSYRFSDIENWHIKTKRVWK